MIVIKQALCKRMILAMNNQSRFAQKTRVDKLVIKALNDAVLEKMESIVARQVANGKTIVL